MLQQPASLILASARRPQWLDHPLAIDDLRRLPACVLNLEFLAPNRTRPLQFKRKCQLLSKVLLRGGMPGQGDIGKRMRQRTRKAVRRGLPVHVNAPVHAMQLTVRNHPRLLPLADTPRPQRLRRPNSHAHDAIAAAQPQTTPCSTACG